MFFRTKAIAAAALTLAAFAVAPITSANAADLPVKAKAKPLADMPFFFVNDNLITYAVQFNATSPGVTNKTVKQVYAYTHFDVWAYGTNFITLSLAKSDHADPASPCGDPFNANPGNCAGAAEFYGLIRSTFGWNQLFNTKMFSVGGVLNNISFEVGVDGETENQFLAPNKKDVVAGLQFAFDLPYKGFLDIAPLYYQEWNHNSYLTPGLVGTGCAPVFACPGISDGNTRFNATWALEINYYMDLGFLPEIDQLLLGQRSRWLLRPEGRRRSVAVGRSGFEQDRDGNQLGTDPSDLRRQQGVLSRRREVLALPRRLGGLPLLGEQVRS